MQAGERTSHLFRLANYNDALVLGTGDLSELALGWATYGVGDQMSHYNVNASVPKTLIQHLIRWVIATSQFDEAASNVLQSVLDTEISPELVPGDGSEDGPAQSTEGQDRAVRTAGLFSYYISRYGFRPSKVAFMALQAWGDRSQGLWPEFLPEHKRNEYDLARSGSGWNCSSTVFPDQSVQADGRPQRPQSGQWWVTQSAWRLARAQ